MIHYHGTPITPRAKLLELAGRCFCVRYGEHRDLEVAHEIGQSVMLDNGAYSFWTSGVATDWCGYYEWLAPWLDHWTTWAVIPDVIDGSEDDNDELIAEWPYGTRGAPVWHMHESLDRLRRLCSDWPRVCIGSSGRYAKVGDARWHTRMREAMDAISLWGGAMPCWLHMLRGLALAGSQYPFSSADSTWIAQNHAGNNTRRTPPRDVRRMAEEMDSRQCPALWRFWAPQLELSSSPDGVS